MTATSSTFPAEFDREQQAILDRIARCQDLLDRVLLEAKRILNGGAERREPKSEEFFARQVPWTHRGELVPRVVPFEESASPAARRAVAPSADAAPADVSAAEFFSREVSWNARASAAPTGNILIAATQSALRAARTLSESSIKE
jgi:hypothetical protein